MVSPTVTVESFPETSREIIESEEFNPPVNVSGELFTDSSMEILESEEFNHPMVISTESFPESAPAIDESSINEPEPCPPAEPANQPLTFNVVDGATEKGKRKLIDSWGFSYNIKRQRITATDWQCSVRPKVSFKEIFKLSIS